MATTELGTETINNGQLLQKIKTLQLRQNSTDIGSV